MAPDIPAGDRLAIQDLLARYAWALDTGDDQAYAQLFTLENRHHNTQLLFESGDANRCVIRSYSTHIYEPEPGAPKVVRMQGHYRDVCVKLDGMWYFAERAWDEWHGDMLTEYRAAPRQT